MYNIKCKNGWVVITEKHAQTTTLLANKQSIQIGIDHEQVEKIFYPELFFSDDELNSILYEKIAAKLNTDELFQLTFDVVKLGVTSFQEILINKLIDIFNSMTNEEIDAFYYTYPFDELWLNSILPCLKSTPHLEFAQEWMKKGLILWDPSIADDILGFIVENNLGVILDANLKHFNIESYPSLVLEAAKQKLWNIVKVLILDGRLDPSLNNNYVLNLASDCDQHEIVVLLSKDSRVNNIKN